MMVVKRDGAVVEYDGAKVCAAVTKAFAAVEGMGAFDSQRVGSAAEAVATDVEVGINGAPRIHVERVQDAVEGALLARGHVDIAREYIAYRDRRAADRADSGEVGEMFVYACDGLDGADGKALAAEARLQTYKGMPEAEAVECAILAATQMIERDPDYSKAAARLLLWSLWRDAEGLLGMARDADYGEALRKSVAHGVKTGRIDSALPGSFDMVRLGRAIVPERDFEFDYLGMRTLADRYLLPGELPQVLWMRVAMGLSLREEDKTGAAIEFYEVMSKLEYLPSTPTLFNAGTPRPQLSSCYLSTVPDSMSGIFGALSDNAALSKWAGGLGNDWTRVRGLGAEVRGTGGKSGGVVPFLNVADAAVGAVNQAGRRRGAACAYLENWHWDVDEFLDLRKNTGDDRRRTHDMSTALWVSDEFMRRVAADCDWTLFSPDEVPELHERYGAEFEEAYRERERDPAVRKRTVKARDLWRRMLGMLYETGHPWIAFKDACNIRNPQAHRGVVHGSNLCTEITLNTSDSEIAVCNLGSVNLARVGRDGRRMRRVVRTAVRMLDNVIDLNFYPVKKARTSNMRHRPIGLGMMGLREWLLDEGVDFDSEEAVMLGDLAAERLAVYGIEASADLALARGRYETYDGSSWSCGAMPQDTHDGLVIARGGVVEPRGEAEDWRLVREKVAEHGMRNSNVTAIAPTATIANIAGVTPSCEPLYRNIFAKANLSGVFTAVNARLVDDLKALGLWDAAMLNDLKARDGALEGIPRVPSDVAARHRTAFEIAPEFIVEAAARRQRWIDQSQSTNLWFGTDDGAALDRAYRLAWRKGLKTTYYCRTLSASQAEAADGEACSLDAECEVCQ